MISCKGQMEDRPQQPGPSLSMFTWICQGVHLWCQWIKGRPKDCGVEEQSVLCKEGDMCSEDYGVLLGTEGVALAFATP